MNELVKVTLKSGIEIVGVQTFKTPKEIKTDLDKIQIVTNRPKMAKIYFDKTSITTNEILSNGEIRVNYFSSKNREVRIGNETVCTIYVSTIAKIENL